MLNLSDSKNGVWLRHYCFTCLGLWRLFAVLFVWMAGLLDVYLISSLFICLLHSFENFVVV